MYVFMYVCMYVRMYVCMYVCMYMSGCISSASLLGGLLLYRALAHRSCHTFCLTEFCEIPCVDAPHLCFWMGSLYVACFKVSMILLGGEGGLTLYDVFACDRGQILALCDLGSAHIQGISACTKSLVA